MKILTLNPERERYIRNYTLWKPQDSAPDKLFVTYAGGKIGSPITTPGLIGNAFRDEETIPDSALEDLKQYCNSELCGTLVLTLLGGMT